MPCETLPETVATHDIDKKSTILIVDDDIELAECLGYRLTEQGFDIRIATNGADAMAMAAACVPTVIILDVLLPDKDGLSICEDLVDSPDTCQIPVIILSGCDRREIVRRSRAAGCRYFLSKPCDPNTLLLLIHRAIEEAEDWLA